MIRILSLFLLMPFFSFSNDSFLNITWDDSTGTITAQIPKEALGQEFLYYSSLSHGIGSNDIGLDRGQLGTTYVVHFYRSGNKLLLIEPNLKYRASSDNAYENAAVEQAFAKSVLWGFSITEEVGKSVTIDITDFLLRDSHGVSEQLASKNQGSYTIDKSKSAIVKEQMLKFPDNTEIEAMLTFVGKPTGDWIKETAMNPEQVTVRTHHSFVRLPELDFESRAYHPAAGYFARSYADYSKPIDEDITVRYILRHRLEKKNPNAALSEAVEPIIYYLDPGTPEPVRSALLEGASWWNQAFEAAGYKDAFKVDILPEGAHPLDVRYNVIQWVHRKTRGWSYGSNVNDPRTGEILKGHVSLGSLRVRQDYLIAQGIMANFDELPDDARMQEIALARLRQLSAHEVGHTIGLGHNFAASTNSRASVMDYPHPFIQGTDISDAYDVGIGEWDKRAVIYGYGTPAEGETETAFLDNVIKENDDLGFRYISDQHSRSMGAMHPYSHLWDSGSDPLEELVRIKQLRNTSLSNLGAHSIRQGTAYSELEKVLVPVYLMHRYQVEAAVKLIGGYEFDYGLKEQASGGGVKVVPVDKQKQALDEMLSCLSIKYLNIPNTLIDLITPNPPGYEKGRETFARYTGDRFDKLAAAEALSGHIIGLLLDQTRLSRIMDMGDRSFSLSDYLRKIRSAVSSNNGDMQFTLMLEKVYAINLLKLSNCSHCNKQVSAMADYELVELVRAASSRSGADGRAHYMYLNNLVEEARSAPDVFKIPGLAKMPPGSPIGCH